MKRQDFWLNCISRMGNSVNKVAYYMQYCKYQKPKYTKRLSRQSRRDTNVKQPVNFTTSLPWCTKADNNRLL